MAERERFIVAEVSKNWPEEEPLEGQRRLLAERFEDVINKNYARGYGLVDWRYDRIVGPRKGCLNETIVAVFERFK